MSKVLTLFLIVFFTGYFQITLSQVNPFELQADSTTEVIDDSSWHYGNNANSESEESTIGGFEVQSMSSCTNTPQWQKSTTNNDIFKCPDDGNVGIGYISTISPLAKLHVNGTGYFMDKLYLTNPTINGSSSMPIILASGDQNGQIHSIVANNWWTDFRSHVNNGWTFRAWNPSTSQYDEVMRMTGGTRRMGIGITSPTSRLHVRQSSNTESVALFENLGGQGSGVQIRAGSGTSASSEYAVFTVSRNSTGSGQLDLLKVNGRSGITYAREIEVNLNAWPDYVFEKNYKLMPLNELENYIKSNKHLPGIPNAESVINENLNLGDMVKLQMEKIEELTLYIIELKKEINNLNKYINER